MTTQMQASIAQLQAWVNAAWHDQPHLAPRVFEDKELGAWVDLTETANTPTNYAVEMCFINDVLEVWSCTPSYAFVMPLDPVALRQIGQVWNRAGHIVELYQLYREQKKREADA